MIKLFNIILHHKIKKKYIVDKIRYNKKDEKYEAIKTYALL